MGVHLGDGHGVLVGTLPSLLGVHGGPRAGPELLVEGFVLHPWEALLIVELACRRAAATDPHCSDESSFFPLQAAAAAGGCP